MSRRFGPCYPESVTQDKEHAISAPASHTRNLIQIGIAFALATPAPVLRTLELTGVLHLGLPSLAQSVLFGISIFAAATLLVWAAEVAEQMISAMLALAVLAIIAVLPEYAVDLYFAMTAHTTPEHAHFALANMTGANRLLVGFAWPLVFFIFWYRKRSPELKVGNQNALGLVFLAAATLYNFSIPLRRNLSLIDGGVLITLFLAYLLLSSRSPPAEEAELVGPARSIGALPKRWRWAAVIGLFGFAAGTVLAAAEPFANGLVDTGQSFGINKFLLVQWVAPIASEAPEFILAAMLALRGRAQAGLTLLVASEVNQWTFLVGSLPIAYSAAGSTLSPLHMDGQQAAEVFLTGAQALFAVAVLMSLSLSNREAGLMFALFAGQLVLPFTEARLAFGALFMLLALWWFVSERGEIPSLLRTTRRELLQPSVVGATHERGG
jgi:cation:H+ antiporter